MSDDLIMRLRALAAGRHSDVSVAVDAVIEIERLRAEIKRLRQYLTWIRDQFDDVTEPWCAERARVALLGGKQ